MHPVPRTGAIRSAAAAICIVLASACTSEVPAPEATDIPIAANGVYGPGTPDPTGRRFGSPPRFEDYPVTQTYQGPGAAPDFTSHPDAERFRGALLRAGHEVNFAGRYVLISRSCGRLCREFVIMDAASGRIFPGLTDAPPFEYRSDSRLIAFEAPEPAPGRVACAGCSAAYYVWENDELVLIPPETWVGSAPPPPAVRDLIGRVRAEEAPRVHAGPSVLRPTWDRLVISARDGTRQVLSDRLAGPAIDRVHVYRGYLAAIDQHVIQIIQIEGTRHAIVDAATGVVTELDAAPVPSPDGTHFVTASMDLVAGHDPNRFRIYRMAGGGPVIEWSLEPTEWGPAAPIWLTESRIRFDRVTADFSTTPISFRRESALLEAGADGWHVVTSEARGSGERPNE